MPDWRNGRRTRLYGLLIINSLNGHDNRNLIVGGGSMQLTIYKIENKSNGKLYIGSTLKSFQSRLLDHKRKSGGNRGLCEWYPEIDPKDLTGEVLEVIENPSVEEVRIRTTESRYCLYYRSLGYELYNKRIDATHHSPESRAKISHSKLGIPCSEAAKNALRAYAPKLIGNRNQCHHVIEYNGKVYEGSTELLTALKVYR